MNKKQKRPQISGDAEAGARWCGGPRRSSHHRRTCVSKTWWRKNLLWLT
jgi:hypothetical protein